MGNGEIVEHIWTRTSSNCEVEPWVTLINENWKPNFYKYEKTRRSGRYNIVMGANQAIKARGISSREYRDIMLNYNHCKRHIEARYEPVDNFMRKYKKCDY